MAAMMVVLADGQKVRPSRILTDQVSESFKKMIINTARSWPVYFSRLFSVFVRYFSTWLLPRCTA